MKSYKNPRNLGNIIEVSVTEEQKAQAEVLYDFYSINNSITKGKSQYWGALGEVVALDFISSSRDAKIENTSDYDMLVDGRTVDVKTKRVTTPPLPNYYCTIAGTSLHQRCDFYFFVRILEDLTKAYLLGYLSRKSFFDKAEFFKEGDIDPNGNGSWKFRADCYNLKIEQLKPFTNK